MLFFLKIPYLLRMKNCSRHADLFVRLFARAITSVVPPSVGIERDLPYRYWERYTGVLSINIENYRINKTMLKSQLTLYSVSIFPQ